MSLANTVRKTAQHQKPFRRQVKVKLAELEMTVTQLAKKLGLARNTVSMAIQHEVGQPTVKRIREELGL